MQNPWFHLSNTNTTYNKCKLWKNSCCLHDSATEHGVNPQQKRWTYIATNQLTLPSEKDFQKWGIKWERLRLEDYFEFEGSLGYIYSLCIKLASTTQQDPVSKNKQKQIPPPQNQLNNYLTIRHQACCSVVEWLFRMYSAPQNQNTHKSKTKNTRRVNTELLTRYVSLA